VPAAGRIGIMALPFVVALIVGSWFSWQIYDDHRQEAAAYARAEAALEAGDYVGAADAFGEAGSYRDAPDRRSATLDLLAPVRAAYLDAISALERGSYEEAILLLTPIHETLPQFERTAIVLEQAQAGKIRTLERQVDLAVTRRDWLAADHLLQELIAAAPEDDRYPERLMTLRMAHAPILFAHAGALYQIGPDMTDRRLLFDEFPAVAPQWSPDRRLITVFDAGAARSQTASLYVMDTATGDVALVSDQAAPDPTLSWSQDGQWVAFVTNETSGVSSLRDRTYLSLYNVVTGEISALFAPPVEDMPSDARFLTDVSSPTWSPDGKHIAFVAVRRPSSLDSGPTERFADVYVADLRTGEIRNITQRTMPAVASVVWSPVDDLLLTWETQEGAAWFEGSETTVRLIDLRDGSIERLSERTSVAGKPAWSPDGTRFAVVTGDATVSVHAIDGSGTASITLEWELGGGLSWSPAGNALLAIAADSSMPSAIFAIEGDALEPAPVMIEFDGAWPNPGPQWGPFSPPAT
jgi:hypothetical protein